ncbi:MAG: ScyD/ScyE family protein [Thermomicrobiales bacterium]
MESDPFVPALMHLSAARRTRRAALRGSLGLAAALGVGRWAAGQAAAADDATPPAADAGPVTLVAHRLTNPRGFTWDSTGALYVSLAGSGGADVLGPDDEGAFATTGYSGVVARIGEDGNPVTISRNLPSTTVSNERTLGPTAVAVLGDALYVLQDTNAMDVLRNSPDPDGVYRVNDDESLTLIADTAAWISANPTEFKPADYNPGGEVFGMVSVGDDLWVVESNNGQVLKVSLDGQIARIADLSTNHPLPTGPSLAPKGGIYVGDLTPAPYTDGSARVMEVAPDGKVTEVWTGLTVVTAVATAPDGTLYAAEMATGNTATPPYMTPETGRIVRQTGKDSLEVVATDINYPIALAFGPDGGLYVAAAAMGSIDPEGYILRIDVSAKGPHDVRKVAATAGGRDDNPVKVTASDTTPAPEAAATEAPATHEAEPTHEAAPTEAAGTPPATDAANTVTMEAGNFYFKPKDVTIPANTAVTFKITNVAQIPHNFSIDNLAISTNLPVGETTDVVVNAPAGTYDFYCNLPGHRSAGMEGVLTVK